MPQSLGVRELDARVAHLGGQIAANLTAGVEQRLHERRQVVVVSVAIDEQALGRATNAGAAHLGIEDDLERHVDVGAAIDVGVADAFQMREHGHPRLILNAGDEAFAAARHQHVDLPLRPFNM